jgi:hypothetical protein
MAPRAHPLPQARGAAGGPGFRGAVFIAAGRGKSLEGVGAARYNSVAPLRNDGGAKGAWMVTRVWAAAMVGVLCVGPAWSGAQPRQPGPGPAQPGRDSQEIELDESTSLKVAALEARMSAVIANFALLQRQAQDLQQEMARLLEERKQFVQEAGRRRAVKDPNEWLFDNKGQRFVRNPRPGAPAPPPAR